MSRVGTSATAWLSQMKRLSDMRLDLDWLGWDIEDTGDGDLRNVPQCIAPARHVGR
jgi:hypothetical protein